ncbi:MAG: hypothetical protein NVS4B10_16360 [Myxococcales bacterium]
MLRAAGSLQGRAPGPMDGVRGCGDEVGVSKGAGGRIGEGLARAWAWGAPSPVRGAAAGPERR